MDSCSSRSSLSCWRRRKISLRIFTSKPSPLASAKTSFLPSFNALISSSMRSTRSTKEQIRSPGISAVLVMPAPSLQEAHTYAAKVTEGLTREIEMPTNSFAAERLMEVEVGARTGAAYEGRFARPARPAQRLSRPGLGDAGRDGGAAYPEALQGSYFPSFL